MENQLVTRQDISLAPIEDIAKFLILAPEKAKAMQAEIRAIKKLGMAKEIYEQKQEELRMVQELVLDAKVRMGELTMEIPKAGGGDHGNQYTSAKNISGNNFGKPKKLVVEELGFSTDQVSRMERLARNRDKVEEEKATAREEDRMPTVENVLRQIKRDAPLKQYNGGGTKEYREQRDRIANAVAELYDEASAEYTIDDLRDEIIVNANSYIKLLGNQITDHEDLIAGDACNVICDVIKNFVLLPIKNIWRNTHEKRA